MQFILGEKIKAKVYVNQEDFVSHSFGFFLWFVNEYFKVAHCINK